VLRSERRVSFLSVACPSGRRSAPRKRVKVHAFRGFKSHRYRSAMGDVCPRSARTMSPRLFFGGATPKPRPAGLRPPDPLLVVGSAVPLAGRPLPADPLAQPIPLPGRPPCPAVLLARPPSPLGRPSRSDDPLARSGFLVGFLGLVLGWGLASAGWAGGLVPLGVFLVGSFLVLGVGLDRFLGVWGKFLECT
jgi:hypothetical protein